MSSTPAGSVPYGSTPATRNPPPSVVPACTIPPTSRARSRSPVSPCPPDTTSPVPGPAAGPLAISTTSESSSYRSSTEIGAPGACLYALVSASCTILYAAWSQAATSGLGRPAEVIRTSVPALRAASTIPVIPATPRAAGWASSTGTGASTPSRMIPTTSRSSCIAATEACRSTPTASRWRSVSFGSTSRAPVCTEISASWWPRLSCMSWAIRWRSRSRACPATIARSLISCPLRSWSACSRVRRCDQ